MVSNDQVTISHDYLLFRNTIILHESKYSISLHDSSIISKITQAKIIQTLRAWLIVDFERVYWSILRILHPEDDKIHQTYLTQFVH